MDSTRQSGGSRQKRSRISIVRHKGWQRKNKGISINLTLTPLGHFCRGSEQSCRDIVCTSVWGCGRWRAAPVKSQTEQHTERSFIQTVLLLLNYSSAQYLGKVPLKVAAFYQNTFTIRYDTRCYFNVRSKADISQLNLPHRMYL